MNIFTICAIVFTIISLLFIFWSAFPLKFGSRLHPGGPSFETCTHFSKDEIQRIQDNHERILGTLKFWKGRAVGYTRIHYYCIIISFISSWAVPFVGALSHDLSQARWLLLALSSNTAFALSLYRSLNILQNMQTFRHGESDYYDLNRKLLDTPSEFGDTSEQQLDCYFKNVADLRKIVRLQETENTPLLSENRKT